MTMPKPCVASPKGEIRTQIIIEVLAVDGQRVSLRVHSQERTEDTGWLNPHDWATVDHTSKIGHVTFD